MPGEQLSILQQGGHGIYHTPEQVLGETAVAWYCPSTHYRRYHHSFGNGAVMRWKDINSK